MIEFHGIATENSICGYDTKIKCLEKLASTHYLIHAHGNNCSPVINNIPDVIELTYVNKNYFDSEPKLNTTPFPIDIDFPNNGKNPDINLNFYPFTHHN